MKDNRNSPFIHDLSRSLVVTGSSIPQATSYTRFNHFQYSDTEVGTYIPDFGDPTASYVVVEGDRGGSTGNHSPTTGSLAQLDIYGEKVYTDKLVRPGLSTRAVMSQRGLSLPLSPGAAEPLFIAKDAASIYSTAAYAELSMMVKLKLTSTTNYNHSIVTLVSAGDPTTDAYSINVTGNEIFSLSTGTSPDGPISSTAVDISSRDFVTVFATFYNTAGGNSVLSRFGVYDVGTGEEVSFEDLGNDSGTAVDLIRPFIYVGYGRGQGAANNEFDAADFASINVAEIAFFDSDLTQEQMQTIARSHLSENQYKSGFNNRAPKRTQQLLDARSVYPASANPLSPGTSTLPFDDEKTKIFGTGSWANSSDKIDIMYPEMLPAHMFSGSAEGRGAEGDVRSFYRDQHHTEYDKRLVAPGAMRQGLSHKETELFNIGTRNSPVVIGEDSDILGGTIQPFDDTHPLADKNEQPAVGEDVIPGLSQRLGDHVAIVIELNPVEDTTIGVERTGGEKSWLGTPTGRVTSMAYFNFSTRKWETAGQNNDFQIPGAMTFTTGSSGGTTSTGGWPTLYPTAGKNALLLKQFGTKLIESSSVGFTGTSGFTIVENAGKNAFAPLASRARPSNIAGFPFHTKYEAKSGQLIDMSDYIDAPFVLEKVEFDVDIAIEDSGPHSLGYRISSTNVGDADADPNTSHQPTLRFYPDVDSPAEGDGTASVYKHDTYAKVLDSQRVSLTRGTFLNGSWCVDANDFTLNRYYLSTGGGAPSYAQHWAAYSTGSLEAKGLSSILLGYQNHNREEIPNSANTWNLDLGNFPRLNPGFKFVEGRSTVWSTSPGQFGYTAHEQFPARVMLPVVPGPRTDADGTGYSPAREGWFSGAQLPHSRGQGGSSAYLNLNTLGVNVSYVPVLAAGLNGVVTGSNDPTGIDDVYGKPWAYIEKRNYDVEGSNYSDMPAIQNGASEGTKTTHGQFTEPGVPFWRAETFFLLRQTKSDQAETVSYSFRVSEASSRIFFPLCPWANMDQPQKVYGRPGVFPSAVPTDFDPGDYFRTAPSGQKMAQMYGPRAAGGFVQYGNKRLASIASFTSGFDRPGGGPENQADGRVIKYDLAVIRGTTLVTGLDNPPIPDQVTWTSSGNTKRELITYGQVVHHGYCAAQDGYVDKIATYFDGQYPSGSYSSKDFASIVNDDVSMFGQGIKISRMQSATNAIIPCDPNVTDSDDSTWNFLSSFSDAPDTFNGQWSFETGERDPGENNGTGAGAWIPSFTFADGYVTDTVGTGLRKDQYRYQTLKVDPSNPTSRIPLVKELIPAKFSSAQYWDASLNTDVRFGGGSDYSHTLDTWQPFLLSHTISATDVEISGSSEWGTPNTANRDDLMALVDEHQISNSPAPYLAPDLVPGGTGFSVICTPAWPTDDFDGSFEPHIFTNNAAQPEYQFGRLLGAPDREAQGWNLESQTWRRWSDYGFFGGFEFAPRSRTPDHPLSEPPTKTWLESGLSRDYNIKITSGFQHEGTNIDYNDSWAGFTLMTASTIGRPGMPPGRESAALPLQANVYRRQWLNFQRGIKFTVPVRNNSATTGYDTGYWVATAPDPFGPAPAITSEVAEGGGFTLIPGGNTSATNGGRQNLEESDPLDVSRREFATWGKRFHRRYMYAISEGGFTPGPLADGFTSGRAFFRRSTSSAKTNLLFQKTHVPKLFARGHTNTDDPDFYSEVSTTDLAGLNDTSVMSGSASEELVQDSLYILQPTDKLILGVQPSLPGWNPGSGLPNNRWAKRWGTYDYEASNEDEKVRHLDWDYDSRAADEDENVKMNLEDPYEPCHGLTMLSGKSRIVLYGSFLRDNKHYSPSSKQKLTSAAVHEALHFDNPVLDQFLTENAYEYGGSNLEHHVAGEMLEGNRGVAGKLSDGTLLFSGSFQRFTRSAETSQVFYDTLMQNPYEICAVDGYVSNRARFAGPNANAWSYIHMHVPTSYLAAKTHEYNERESNTTVNIAQSYSWPHSFPFEEKYDNVTRLISKDLSFAPVTLGFEALGIARNSVLQSLAIPSPITPHLNGSTAEEVGTIPGDFNNNMHILTGSSLDVIPYSHWDVVQEYTDSGAIDPSEDVASYGASVTTIRNLAGTADLWRDGEAYIPLGSVYAALNAAAADRNSAKGFRKFFAAMTGYGRVNRKQLDADKVQPNFIDYSRNAEIDSSGNYISILSSDSGIARFHPAGLKYGYMNCDHLSPSAVHRADRYGQFRDMLEQRLYGKVYSFGDEFNKRGESEAAVTCIFVDADGAPIDDATKTQCLNLSTSATSRKPFIEGEVLREIIINSESVTIE